MHSRDALNAEGTHDAPRPRRSSRTEMIVFLLLGISVIATALLVVVPGVVSG